MANIAAFVLQMLTRVRPIDFAPFWQPGPFTDGLQERWGRRGLMGDDEDVGRL